MSSSMHEFRHERMITISLLSLIIGLLLVMGWKAAQHGYWVLAVILVTVILILVRLMYICLRKRITIDPKRKLVILEFVRYPTWVLDIYLKRRVEVPFDKIACVRQGLMRTKGGYQLSWHVYTRESRFDFTVWMKDEKKLREMLRGMGVHNNIPDSECRYLRSGISFESVLLIATGCLFVVAIGYAVLINVM